MPASVQMFNTPSSPVNSFDKFKQVAACNFSKRPQCPWTTLKGQESELFLGKKKDLLLEHMYYSGRGPLKSKLNDSKPRISKMVGAPKWSKQVGLTKMVKRSTQDFSIGLPFQNKGSLVSHTRTFLDTIQKGFDCRSNKKLKWLNFSDQYNYWENISLIFFTTLEIILVTV